MIKDKKKLITVVGYYGMGNLGDELLLHNLVEYLPGDQYKFNVLINQGARRDLLKNFDTVYTEKKNLAGLIKTLFKSEFLVFTGGNVLSNNSFRFYSFISILAYLFKTKVVFLAVGANDIKFNFINKLLLTFWNKFHFVSVRDKKSYDCLKEVNGLKVIPDLAFLPTPIPIKTKNLPTKRIGLNPRNIAGQNIDELIQPFIDISLQFPQTSSFFIFSTSVGQKNNQDDWEACSKLNQELNELGYNSQVIKFKNLQDFSSFSSKLDVSYNFRLHSYLHNLTHGIPSYIFHSTKIPKTKGIMEFLDLENCEINFDEFSKANIKNIQERELNTLIHRHHIVVKDSLSLIGLSQ